MRLSRRKLYLTVALAALPACGDAPTTDSRQWYTKAPLEDPGLTITPEETSDMAELGEPDLLALPGLDDTAASEGGSAAGNEAGDAGAGETDASGVDGDGDPGAGDATEDGG